VNPRLVPHASLRWNPARGQWLLMLPEAVVILNETAAAVLHLCDGRRSVDSIVDALAAEYDDVAALDVADFLHHLADEHLVDLT
jgi:pyrroloquinoline quinone biosynthesis protein D